MYELIDASNMKEGETYFINRHGYIIEVIFVNYQLNSQFAIFTYPNCPVYFAMSNNSVYRYVEYKSKIKEKYYAKCLDILLRRLDKW
jgi:hypothetical protein